MEVEAELGDRSDLRNLQATRRLRCELQGEEHEP